MELMNSDYIIVPTHEELKTEFILCVMAEDDPDDADFEPDYGITSERTLKKVCDYCDVPYYFIHVILFLLLCSS